MRRRDRHELARYDADYGYQHGTTRRDMAADALTLAKWREQEAAEATDPAVREFALELAREQRQRARVYATVAIDERRDATRTLDHQRTRRPATRSRERRPGGRRTARARARSGDSGDPDLPGEPAPPGGTRPGRYTYAVLPPEARS